VLTCLTATLSVVGLWARRNTLNTSVVTERMTEIAEQPAVQTAVADQLTDDLLRLLDVESYIEEALPERGQILVPPLTNAVESFTNDQVLKFVQSETFLDLWRRSVETAHRAAVALLNEKSTQLVSTADGKVVLNLLPLVDAVLAEIGDLSPTLAGHTIDLPTVTTDDLPDDVRQTLEKELDIDLPEGFGTITVFDETELGTAQRIVALVDRFLVVLCLATAALAIAAVAVSPDRRRTVLQMALGLGLGVVMIRRLAFALADQVVNHVGTTAAPAVSSAVGVIRNPLVEVAGWVLLVLVLVALVTFLTGPSPWAVRVRDTLRGGVDAVRRTIDGAANDPRLRSRVFEGRLELLVGVGIVAGLILLFLDLSWLVALLVAIVAVSGILWLKRLDPDAEVPTPAEGAPDPG
jgi:hypothetical protein